MGVFGGKPKQPDYAKIQEQARLKEEARIAKEKAIAEQAQQEAVAAAESKRKAFYQGIQSTTDTTNNKRFMQGV